MARLDVLRTVGLTATPADHLPRCRVGDCRSVRSAGDRVATHRHHGRVAYNSIRQVLAVTAVLFALTTLPACGGGDDPGKAACQMMAADKKAGTNPDSDRERQEFDALAKSHNANLQAAGRKLASDDTAQQFDAVGDLYTGCAAIGVPLA